MTGGLSALIVGGGAGVWKDVGASEALLGADWWDVVIAANDIGCHWPRRLDHWCTLHPEKMPGWQQERRANGHPGGYIAWSRPGGGRSVHREIQTWGGGASGLLAVTVAIDGLGCSRVVLCGVPMERAPHFAESTVHVKGRMWSSADTHWKKWTDPKVLPRIRGVVRSMSGRTRELLGAPDLAWLNEEEAA